MSRIPHVVLATVAASVCLLTPTASAQTMSADEKELAAFRLTLPGVKKLAAVMKAMSEEAANDPRAQELAKVRGEIAALENKEELTEAEEAKLEKLRERGEAIENEQDATPGMSNNKTLDDMERDIKAFPAAMRILSREGMTPREFVVTTAALMQAALVEGFSQGKADLTKLPAGVNPENVKFIRENKAELEALKAAMGGNRKQ